MAIALYFDVHIDHAVLDQLRLRQVDVVTAQEDAADRFTDAELLERASQLGRPLFTHDIRFKAMAESWQAQRRSFCGLIFAHQLQVSIGKMVTDLELVAKQPIRKIGSATLCACRSSHARSRRPIARIAKSQSARSRNLFRVHIWQLIHARHRESGFDFQCTRLAEIVRGRFRQ